MDLARFTEHIAYVLPLYDRFRTFYDVKFTRWKFTNFRGRQKAFNEMSRMLTWGSKKYNSERPNLQLPRAANKFPKPLVPPDPEPPDGRRIIVYGSAVFPSSVRFN